jgi:hypothetical protein
MKTAFTILVIILAVLACGCTAAAPAADPAQTPAADQMAYPFLKIPGPAVNSGFISFNRIQSDPWDY